MNTTHENNETQRLRIPSLIREPTSRLDILSSVAKLDFLKEITSLDDLSENEGMVIEVLNHYSKLSGDTHATASAARDLILSCRQSQISSKASQSDQNNHGTFDRLVYLLDRYLEFCQARNLSAWPIDHLKVSIWIKNDVIVTSNSTRMKPLRKTVRCYVTSLESIRIKTLHLFKGIHLPVHLMKSTIIMQILNGLSSERDNLEQRLGGNEALVSQAESVSGNASERDALLKQIRARSGDQHSAEAMKIVKASRSGESVETGHKPTGGSPNRKVKAKPDPHIHTLKRFRNFCFLNKIPMWPIDAPRVALWLRESVLACDPRSKNKKSGVSFRTIQVYLSRLEYSRQKTEHLFPTFPNYGVSLYKSEEIADILSSQKNKHTTVESHEACNNSYEELEMPAALTTIHDGRGHVMNAPLNESSSPSFSKEKTCPEIGFGRKRKTPTDCEEYHMPSQKERRMDPEISRRDAKQRHALRDFNDRRTPSINLDTDIARMGSRHVHQQPAPLSPSTPSSGRFSFPPISEWFSPTSLCPAKKTKGCIAFILCSDEESERSSFSRNSPELLTPAGSPRKFENSREKFTMSPTRYLESPTIQRFCSSHTGSEAHPSIGRQESHHRPHGIGM